MPRLYNSQRNHDNNTEPTKWTSWRLNRIVASGERSESSALYPSYDNKRSMLICYKAWYYEQNPSFTEEELITV